MIYSLGEPLIDVTWDSGDARELDIIADETSLTISFDAERFVPGREGGAGLFLRVGDAPGLLAAIDLRRRELPARPPLDV